MDFRHPDCPVSKRDSEVAFDQAASPPVVSGTSRCVLKAERKTERKEELWKTEA